MPKAYNVEVTNPKGIKYLTVLSLYGKYNLNEKPLNLNGFYTYLCGEDSELDDSNFQEVRINQNYTLDYNIKGNVEIYNGITRDITVTIPENVVVTINGNLTVGSGGVTGTPNLGNSTIQYDEHLINNGTLICSGDVNFVSKGGTGYYKPSDNSTLVVKGNLTVSDDSDDYITKGTIEFSGTEQQKVSLSRASIIEISNTSDEGVVFTSGISVNRLFDHKGNNFTLYNNGLNSAFVDYDGDGLLDNVDPHPTVPETQIEYTVIFKDENGDILSSEKYRYGDNVTVPAAPTKASDNTYIYDFAGWDKAVVDCAGNTTYTATYTPIYIDYTVAFKNWNGELISSNTYHYGDVVELPDDPTKEKDGYYIYTFAGWSKEVVSCAGNATYTATFDADHYHTYKTSVINPTCTNKGYTKNTCACGNAYNDKYVNSLGHTYSNNCDKTCNICGKTRTVGAHKYSNNCDTTCNYCNAKRTIKHTYSNSCDTTCNVCKATKAITHSYKTTTTKATLTKNGSIVKKCTVCGKVDSKSTIKYAKTFKLSTTTYTYDGKVKTPSVTVKDSAGKTLKKNTDYTVTYANGRKNVGTYKVTIKMKGKYSGTKTLTFKINPAKTTVSKLTAGKKSITVAITKKSTQVTGYQIQYSTSKKFTNAKTKTISSYKTTKYALKSLSAKKTYYVRVRTYKTVGNTTYYSGWSTYKYVKTK